MGRKKTCPECGERIQADARVCRHCGHRFEDAPEDAPVEPVFEEAERRYETARRAALALIILVGGVLFAFARRGCDGFEDSSEQVGTILGSVIGAGLLASIYALLGMLFQRLRSRQVSFLRSLLSVWVIGFLALTILGQIAREADERDNECGSDNSASSSPQGTPDPLGQKLVGKGDDLSAPDRVQLDETFRLRIKFRREVNQLINTYIDPKVSGDAWIAQAEAAIPVLNTDLSQLTTEINSISDEEVRLFLDDLPPILSGEVAALNDLVIAIRTADLKAEKAAQGALDQATAQDRAWARQFQARVKPYV